jgi:hypothetical protein
MKRGRPVQDSGRLLRRGFDTPPLIAIFTGKPLCRQCLGWRELRVTLSGKGVSLMNCVSKWLIASCTILLVAVWAVAAPVARAEDFKKVSKEELKAELEKPGVTVLDVRAVSDWESATVKIKGAVREDPTKVETWTGKYPKDKRLVLYCA